MHLGREHAEDGARPGVAALRVGYHLALVDDRHVVAPLQRELFRRRGHVRVVLAYVLLLARGQRAVHAVVEQRLLRLQRQQAQRRQIYAGSGADEALEAGVGLAGVRAAYVQYEVAAHGARLRVLVLGVQRYQQREAGAYRLWHVPDRPHRAEAVGEEHLVREALGIQEGVHVRLRLLRAKLRQHLSRYGVQHGGVALEHAVARGVGALAAHAGPGAQEGL